jgi:hypothetical protein
VPVHGRFVAVDRRLARTILAEGEPVFEGDTSVWEHLPRAHTAYYRSPAGWSDDALFLVDRRRRTVEVQRFDWFDDSYDRGYQGIVGVAEVPGSDLVVVAVQRDSAPVLYDPTRRRMVRKIPLAGRRGNAGLRFRKKAPELWAVDYDTLVQVDTGDWSTSRMTRLRGADGGRSASLGNSPSIGTNVSAR